MFLNGSEWVQLWKTVNLSAAIAESLAIEEVVDTWSNLSGRNRQVFEILLVENTVQARWRRLLLQIGPLSCQGPLRLYLLNETYSTISTQTLVIHIPLIFFHQHASLLRTNLWCDFYLLSCVFRFQFLNILFNSLKLQEHPLYFTVIVFS